MRLRSIIAAAAALVIASPAAAQSPLVAPCRMNADTAVDAVPGVKLRRMSKSASLYSWAGGYELSAVCDWAPKTDAVRSLSITWDSDRSVRFPDYLRTVAKLISSFTTEPSDSSTKMLDRCIPQSRKLDRSYQAVGQKATIDCTVLMDGTGTLITIFVKLPGDVEN